MAPKSNSLIIQQCIPLLSLDSAPMLRSCVSSHGFPNSPHILPRTDTEWSHHGGPEKKEGKEDFPFWNPIRPVHPMLLRSGGSNRGHRSGGRRTPYSDDQVGWCSKSSCLVETAACSVACFFPVLQSAAGEFSWLFMQMELVLAVAAVAEKKTRYLLYKWSWGGERSSVIHQAHQITG